MLSFTAAFLFLGTSFLQTSDSFILTTRARNYLYAINVTSTAVATEPGNYTNNNHFTNALVAKLILFDEHKQKSDYNDALAIANHIIDTSAVDTSFGGLFGAPLLTGTLGKYLPTDTLNSLEQLLYNALPDNPTDPWCDISYSNIYLMHTANLITLGEALLDYGPKAAKAVAAGYNFYWTWVNYTHDAGFHEFDSPTYTSVQMNGLYIMALYASNEKARSTAKDVLDYLWVETGTVWFPGGQMQAGPHSRDYDFLFGKGLLTAPLYLAGITDGKDDAVYTCEWKDVHCEALVCPWDVDMTPDMVLNCIGSGLQAVFAYLAMVNTMAYPVPDKAILWARSVDKMVEKRWQEGPAGDYQLYVSTHYALGVISDDYDTNLHDPYIPYPPNAQDKVLSLALGSRSMPQSNPLPVLSLSPDWRRSGVYGKKIWADAGKPVKLRLRPTAAMAQTSLGSVVSKDRTNRATLQPTVTVMLLALDPLLNETVGWNIDNATHLAMNTILPWVSGDFSLRINSVDATDSVPVSTSQDFAIDAGSLPTVAIMGGGGAAVVRVFLTDTCGGMKQSTSTVRGDAGDDGGLLFNAIRLETVLFDSEDNDVRVACGSDGLLRVGMIVAGLEAPNADEDLKALERLVLEAQPVVTQEGALASVDVTVGGVRFELGRDLSGVSEANKGAIKWRRVDGRDVVPVDGSAVFVNGDKVVEFPSKEQQNN